MSEKKETVLIKTKRAGHMTPRQKSLVKAGDPTKAMVKAIAMDIGKEVVAYIAVIYPNAINACSSTFPTSVRNCVYNEIMAAIEVNDEGKIIARLAERKKFRREWKALYKKIREKP